MIAVAGWHFGLAQFGNHWLDTGSVSDQNAFLAVFDPASALQDFQNAAPATMRLSPNPFSDKLQIRLKKDGNIGEIEIYNLKGQLVTKLTSPLQKDNDSAYLWDGKDAKGKPVPAGVYIIKNGTNSIKTVKLP